MKEKKPRQKKKPSTLYSPTAYRPDSVSKAYAGKTGPLTKHSLLIVFGISVFLTIFLFYFYFKGLSSGIIVWIGKSSHYEVSSTNENNQTTYRIDQLIVKVRQDGKLPSIEINDEELERIERILAWGPDEEGGVLPWLKLKRAAPSSKEIRESFLKVALGEKFSEVDDFPEAKVEIKNWVDQYYEEISKHPVWLIRRYFSGEIQFITVYFFVLSMLLLSRNLIFVLRERSLVLESEEKKPWGFIRVVDSDKTTDINLLEFLNRKGSLKSKIRSFLRKASLNTSPEYFLSQSLLCEFTDEVAGLSISNDSKTALSDFRIEDPEDFFEFCKSHSKELKDTILDSNNSVPEALKNDIEIFGIKEPGGFFTACSKLSPESRKAILNSSALSLESRKAILDSGIEDLEDFFEAEQHYIRWMIDALPALGFVGTILGLGKGLGSAYRPVVPTNDTVAEIQNLTTILGVAFDTTLVALILGLAGRLFLASFNRFRDHFLVDLKKTFDSKIQSNGR